MTNLLLQPSGANEYEVIDGDWIVGHIVLLSPAMARNTMDVVAGSRLP
jgi:hypothetical protein